MVHLVQVNTETAACPLLVPPQQSLLFNAALHVGVVRWCAVVCGWGDAGVRWWGAAREVATVARARLNTPRNKV